MFDGFLGQFTVCPGIHGPLRVRRRAGQVENLDNLFRGEGIGGARPRRVGEDGDGGAQLGLRLEPVVRSDDMQGFVVLPRRWVVARTLAWLTQCRRLGKDYEGLPLSSEAMIYKL